MKKYINIGIDIGSTTVKVVAMEKDKILYEEYRRHFSDTKKTVHDLLEEVIEKFNSYNYKITTTGSGALALANYLELPFVQEVIACKNAIKKYADATDVAIELGGEDAKIIYFDQTIEQRMNGSCAGGTGAFLDQMAVLLNTTTEGLNTLAKDGTTIYPIASRCGVFAKTDIQPLLNEGAKKEDVALSIMQAVVNQTISGLACGKPIKGNVIFLGGPLNYLSVLKERFIKTLNLKDNEIVEPKVDSRLFVCIGAILDDEEKKTYTKNGLKEAEKVTTNIGVIVSLTVLMALISYNSVKPKFEDKFVNESSYPVAACDYIVENIDLSTARFYNEYNYGSYMLFRGIPVFIDSRADLYAPEFSGNKEEDIFTDFINTSSISKFYEETFEKYNINYVILGKKSKTNMIITKTHDENYKELYSDDNFVVYERLNAQN